MDFRPTHIHNETSRPLTSLVKVLSLNTVPLIGSRWISLLGRYHSTHHENFSVCKINWDCFSRTRSPTSRCRVQTHPFSQEAALSTWKYFFFLSPNLASIQLKWVIKQNFILICGFLQPLEHVYSDWRSKAYNSSENFLIPCFFFFLFSHVMPISSAWVMPLPFSKQFIPAHWAHWASFHKTCVLKLTFVCRVLWQGAGWSRDF